MKPKLSPLQLEEKKARSQLTYITNKVKGDWSFGKLKTFGDMLHSYGAETKQYFSSELNHILTFQDVKDYLDDRRIEFETYYWLKYNPPQIFMDYEIETHPTILTDIKQIKEEDGNFTFEREAAAEEYANRLPKVERNKAFLFWFQKKAIVQILDKLNRGDRAILLIGGTGTGKTWILGYILAWMVENKWAENKTITPWPLVYVTKASIVIKTQRDLKREFGITEDEVLVVGIDQLRSIFGKRFVKEDIIIEHGEEHCKWIWRKNLYPVVIVWDECQVLKNTQSKQSQIGQSYNDIDTDKTVQLFASASPGTRVSEFKCFCVAARVPYTFGIQKNAPLTNIHWSDFATNIASDYGRLEVEPEDHSPGAINRLMNYMDNYIVRVKGVRTQFKAINKIKVMHFETQEGQQDYNNAWEKFQKEKAEIESNDEMSSAQSVFNILAQLTVFLKAAESNKDRISFLTRESYHDVQEGFAAVVASKYKITIVKCVIELIEKYGVSRDQISLIWGGAPIATKKQKLKKNLVSNDVLMDIFAKEGITLDDLDLEDVDVVEPDNRTKKYRLGAQNAKERQKEIDRFQQGKSLYCFYTFKAGGVGLSLHHCDEWTKEKVRRKESGYAYEEDIIKIPTRPRITRITPVWSAIEAVQGVGRVPRLTSLSDTLQWLIYFAGTVEERQARVMGMKLHCLTKVVRNKESFEDMIIGRKGMTDEDVEKAHLTDVVDTLHKEQEDEENTGYNEEEDNE